MKRGELCRINSYKYLFYDQLILLLSGFCHHQSHILHDICLLLYDNHLHLLVSYIQQGVDYQQVRRLTFLSPESIFYPVSESAFGRIAR